MPNWCNNTITINAEDELLDSFEQFLDENNGKEWFSFFKPMPQELVQNGEWYGWAIENWGCKWNCDAQDWSRDEEGIHFWFDSPWGPPIALYDSLTEDNVSVDAYYLEEGIGFVGSFIDGKNEEYEYEYGNPDSLEDIPDYLVEHWNLQDFVEDSELDLDEDE